MKSRWVLIGAILLCCRILGGATNTAEDVVSVQQFVLSGEKVKVCCGGPAIRSKAPILKLDRAAMIVEVSGSATHYCIRSEGRDVLCGDDGAEMVVGEILAPGTYSVFIGLRGEQKKATVRVFLEPYENNFIRTAD